MTRHARRQIERRIRERYPDDCYVQYHAARYARVLELAHAAMARGEKSRDASSVLDVGRSHLTSLLAEHLGCRVDTLGFEPDQETATGRHYQFDLNDAHDPAKWRAGLPAYGLIVIAEVVEHLHTPPVQVLSFLRRHLSPRGSIVLQTPNAAAIHKRLMLLMGKHPYDPMSPNPKTPGHIREYTMRELKGAAAEAGLEVGHSEVSGYFDYRFRFDPRTGAHRPTPRSAWVNVLYRVMPPTLRRGVTMVLMESAGTAE